MRRFFPVASAPSPPRLFYPLSLAGSAVFFPPNKPCTSVYGNHEYRLAYINIRVYIYFFYCLARSFYCF